MSADTVVIDLDGTLANIDHRLHLVKRDKPDFEAFYDLCDKDTPNNWCIALIEAMSRKGFQIAIVSARTKRVETKTREWLLYSLNPSTNYSLYLLRDDGSNTPDVELKFTWLLNYGKNRILFAVDDRERVVDMWRREGITCLQCAFWPEYKRNRK